MIKLLSIEFYKYTRSTLFYIFSGLFIGLVILAEVITMNIGSKLNVTFNYPDAWNYLLYAASWLDFFLGLMVLISITTEFQYRTMRQHVVDGLNKETLFTSKILYALCIAVAAVVLVCVSVIVISSTQPHTGTGKSFTDGISLVSRYFVQVLGYMSMAFFFGTLLRTTALGMIVYLFYMPIEGLLTLVLFHKPSNVGYAQYFPKTCFASLVQQPQLLKTAKAFVGMNDGGPSDLVLLLLAIFYIIAFMAGSYLLLKQRDM